MSQRDYEAAMLALLLWREARGEDHATQRCVAWSVRNRVRQPSWWGRDWVQVMSKPEQYSSLTHQWDQNLVQYPAAADPSWLRCLDVANEVYSPTPQPAPGGMPVDAAQGATHYFDKSLDHDPPFWAARMTHVMDSGSFHFYK